MNNYTFSINNDTKNAKLYSPTLLEDINTSNITKQASRIDTSGDDIIIVFSAELTSEEQVTLLSLINAHNGEIPTEPTEPAKVEIVAETAPPPFASKILTNGTKLYKRVHGVKKTIAANSTDTLRFTVPYIQCKITGADILGGSHGDTCDFNIYDNSIGTISTIPNYKLNQFGFQVCIVKDFHKEHSNYDADLIQGMVVELNYTNTLNEPALICMNVIIHEVKA